MGERIKPYVETPLLAMQAGVAVSYIVYSTTLMAGSAVAQTANAGLNFVGLAASMGTTYMAGPIVGATIATAASCMSSSAKHHIETGTQTAAMVSGGLAGAGTLVAVTASWYLAKAAMFAAQKTFHEAKRMYQHEEPTDNKEIIEFDIIE